MSGPEQHDAFVIAADHVLPVAGKPLSPGWVEVADGLIQKVGHGDPPRDRGPVVHYDDAAVLPGLVDAHTHLGCGFLKGLEGGRDFVEWMTKGIAPKVITAARETPESIAEGARLAAREALEAGITFVADSFFLDVGRSAARNLGLKGVFLREYFGASADDLEAYAAETRESIAAAVADGRDDFGLAPHAPYTCPERILREVAREARERALPLTIHAAESVAEGEMFAAGRGALFDLFAAGGREGRYRLGRSPIAALNDAGILGPRTLLVHAVHLSDADIALIAAGGASVVHCPGSNLRLGVGIAPFAKLRQAGVNVAIGTDSAASNGKLDLFEEMRLAIHLARLAAPSTVLSPAAALAAVTLDAAKAVGKAATIGSLEKAKAADFAVVRLDRPRHRPFTDPVAAVVFSAVPEDVLAVYIDGVARHVRER